MWKDIKDYEGLYEINSSGHIRRKGSAKLLKQAKGKDYMQVSLCKCNHKVTKTVHRLVAETFLENPNELRCVNHKDENKLNNNVENLEWCSAKYNTSYGDCIQKRANSHRGKKHRYSEHVKCRKITQQFDNNMNLIKEFNSLTEASKSTGIAIQNISASCLGKTKESGGFIWRYKT